MLLKNNSEKVKILVRYFETLSIGKRNLADVCVTSEPR